MATVNHPEFQTYLQSISDKYKCWWNFYTLTDAEYFDFGLMVQEVQAKKKREKQQEEIELLPVLEGIRKYADKHVLLIGKPGSGKSTSLQQLLWEDAEAIIQGEKRIIPVLVELRNWDTSVENLIYKFLRKNKHRIDKDEIEDLLYDEQLLLLMDGLNELPSDKARDNVAQFRQYYSETPMIFTTRDLAVGGNLGIDKQLEMQPLTETQMREFVIAYLPQQSEQMLQQLHNRLRELGETPLILKMLCDVFKLGGEIPENKGELFRKFDSEVNHIKEDKETVPIPEGLRRWKGELLQYLAFEMMQPENPQGNPTDFRLSISRSQTEAILKNFLKGEVEFPAQKAKDWLDGLLKHCLLESRVSESEQVVIQFHHQQFQEYYAAEHLLRLLPNLSDEKLQRDYLNLLKWTEPLALILGLVEDEAQALRVTKLGLDVDLMLGARLAGEVRKEFQEKTVGLVSEQKLKNGQEVPDWLKVQLFGKTRSQAAIAYLQKFLQDPDSDVRRAAVWVLRQVGEPAIDVLFKILEHPDSGVREAAISALGEIGNDIAIPKLIEMLEDSEPDVRQKAIFSLEKLDCETVIPGLLKATQDPDWNVKEMAKLALKEMNDKVVVAVLIKALQNPDSSIRNNVADMLGEIGDETAIPALSKAQEDVDLDFSLRAKYALFKLHNKSVHNECKNYQNNHKIQESEKQEKIIKSLKNLEHSNPTLRGNAIVELIGLDCKQAISGIINALKDPSPHVRYNAINGIARFYNKFPEFRKEIKAVTHTLIEALRDIHSSVRSIAASTLSSIGSKEAIPALIEVLKDSDYLVRISAAQALGKFINETTIPALVKSLQDPNFLVRDSVSETLAKIKEYDIEKYLPYFIDLISTQAGQQALRAIIGIQERCKFYNHEIFHSQPVEEDKSNNSTLPNINNFYAPVGIVNSGDTRIQGNQIGTQNNQ